jgi:hypothetical protein
MGKKGSAVTDHSAPTSKRVELATAAVWEVATLCTAVLEQAAKIEATKAHGPYHLALIIKLLATRAYELAEVAGLCLNEDEATQPIADLERLVSHG